MLFYSFFKSLVGKDVVVELKNDLSICGTLHSVDQFLNIKLTDISVTDPEKYPHMLSVKNCFIRGSVVRYVQLPADECDTQLLQDAARKEAAQSKQWMVGRCFWTLFYDGLSDYEGCGQQAWTWYNWLFSKLLAKTGQLLCDSVQELRTTLYLVRVGNDSCYHVTGHLYGYRSVNWPCKPRMFVLQNE